MGGGQSSRSDTAIGLLVLVAIGGALLYGGARFVIALRDERSPAVLAWIAMGVLLLLFGILLVALIASPFHADADAVGTVGAVVGLVMVVAGLGGSFYWVHVREPPLVSALGAACRGEGVDAAPMPAGARRVIVLDDRGHKIDWTTHDATWRARKVTEGELIACIERTEKTVETCNYRQERGGPTSTIDRIEEILTTRMIEAHTAKALGQFELRGTPRACKKVETQGQGDLHGHVSFATFSKFLAPYVAP